MLNVPESVKALFKQDGIRKNFRVHFPGGELPDITNDNVVQESVQFTESLCSQDVLKFGLTEASVLEFETVGVANMYGMTIEAGIEIDLSSLSAAELAEIEAGSWDGVYVSESDTDLGFPFFRVPYGVFRVESCPRDHQAMAHRKVQAYGKMSEMVKMSPLEEKKMAAYLPDNESFDASLMRILYSNIGYYNQGMLTEAGFEKTELSFSEAVAYYSFDVKRKLNPQSPTISCAIEIFRNQCSPDPDALFDLDVGAYSYESLLAGMDALDSRYIFIQAYDSTGQALPLTGDKTFRNFLVAMFERFSYEGAKIRGPIDYEWSDIPCFWPYRNQVTGFTVQYPTKIKFTEGSSTWSATYYASNTDDIKLSRYEYSGNDLTLNLRSTLQGTTRLFPDIKTYAYVNSFSYSKLLNGFLELNARFGRLTRSGNYEQMRLSRASPLAVVPGDYSGFWWDEYDVLPIGSIKYAFTDTENKAQDNVYVFGSGLSVYDMADNEVLELLSAADIDAINDLLDGYFIPYLGPIAFTPIDLTMKGLPYLEAGDYLAVTAEDGTIAYSFAMRQTISGIQVLTAEIESTSGEIIESEAGT